MIKKEESEGLCVEPDIIIILNSEQILLSSLGERRPREIRGLSQGHRG